MKLVTSILSNLAQFSTISVIQDGNNKGANEQNICEKILTSDIYHVALWNATKIIFRNGWLLS
jgi:hypothetical protein